LQTIKTNEDKFKNGTYIYGLYPEISLNVDILPEIGHIPMNKMDTPTLLCPE